MPPGCEITIRFLLLLSISLSLSPRLSPPVLLLRRQRGRRKRRDGTAAPLVHSFLPRLIIYGGFKLESAFAAGRQIEEEELARVSRQE